MPAKNEDLHGMVPDKCAVALILIDVINDLEFPGSEQLTPFVLPMAEAIADLKKRARAEHIPVVYVNDNFGRWQSDFNRVIEHCLQDDVRGKRLVELLRPDDEDYFVLKPKHSGFFSTNLDILLNYLDAKTLILTGLAGNICVLFTANDAFMRDFNVIVPEDCIASNTAEDNQSALQIMRRVLRADTRPSPELDLKAIKRHGPAEKPQPQAQNQQFADMS